MKKRFTDVRNYGHIVSSLIKGKHSIQVNLESSNQDRICNFVGQLPVSLLFTAHDSAFVQVLLRRCSPGVRAQLRVQHIINSCCNALMENGLRNLSEDRERALNIMIRVFEVQLQDVEVDVNSGTFDLLSTYSSMSNTTRYQCFLFQPCTA